MSAHERGREDAGVGRAAPGGEECRHCVVARDQQASRSSSAMAVLVRALILGKGRRRDSGGVGKSLTAAAVVREHGGT
eukprot:4937691-Prymnesium_polylepis.1